MTLIRKKEKNDSAVIGGVFLKYYLSSMLAIICGCIGSIVGNIVIGNTVSEDKLAVISLTLPIYYVFATLGNLAGIGGSAVCAGYIGKVENEKCKSAFTATYIFTVAGCIFFSVLFAVLLPFIIPVLGTPAELTKDVYDYGIVMIIGGVFTACTYLSFNFLRLDGKSVETTLTFVIMAAINVLCDFLFAFLGVLGISLATVAGSAAATVFGLVMLRKSELLLFTRLNAKELFSAIGNIVKTGSPGATENISILLKSYLFNQMIVAVVGSGALSVLSVVNSLNSFSMGITVGCTGALLPLVGVLSTEKDTPSIRSLIKNALGVSGMFLTAFVLIIEIGAPFIATIFGMKENATEVIIAVRMFGLSLPLALISNVLIYMHLTNGHTILSNILTALRWFGYAVGCAFVLMKLIGSVGLWISFFAADLFTILTAVILQLIICSKNKNLSKFFLLDLKYEKSGSAFAICVDDTNEDIQRAVDALTEFCDDNDLMPKQAMRITLAIDEMAHLAATYSTSQSNNHMISIRVLLHADVTVMRLRYAGAMFNPIDYYNSKKTDKTDLDAMLELADMLGMKLVTDSCDVVDYRTTFGINNLTVIN